MTDTVAGQSQDQSDQQTPAGGRYRSTRGLDYDSVPWKLWEKSKKLFWDPADLDFSQDVLDWQTMTGDERQLVALSARGFMVGEEAVTLDIIPLLQCMSDLGRLEDTMYCRCSRWKRPSTPTCSAGGLTRSASTRPASTRSRGSSSRPR